MNPICRPNKSDTWSTLNLFCFEMRNKIYFCLLFNQNKINVRQIGWRLFNNQVFWHSVHANRFAPSKTRLKEARKKCLKECRILQTDTFCDPHSIKCEVYFWKCDQANDTKKLFFFFFSLWSLCLRQRVISFVSRLRWKKKQKHILPVIMKAITFFYFSFQG